MQRIHHFLDGRLVVPPVNVQDIDVACPELLQTGFDTDVQRLRVVSCIVYLLVDALGANFEVRGILQEENVKSPDKDLAICAPSLRLRAGRECPFAPSTRQ